MRSRPEWRAGAFFFFIFWVCGLQVINHEQMRHPECWDKHCIETFSLFFFAKRRKDPRVIFFVLCAVNIMDGPRSQFTQIMSSFFARLFYGAWSVFCFCFGRLARLFYEARARFFCGFFVCSFFCSFFCSPFMGLERFRCLVLFLLNCSPFMRGSSANDIYNLCFPNLCVIQTMLSSQEQRCDPHKRACVAVFMYCMPLASNQNQSGPILSSPWCFSFCFSFFRV